MTDIGISCQKDSYGRTAGKPLGCTSDMEYDAGLCYPPCPEGAEGVGPVCWGHCPEGTSSCGGVLCLDDDTKCTHQIIGTFKDIYKTVIDIARHAAAGTVIDIAEIATDFNYPNCPNWSAF